VTAKRYYVDWDSDPTHPGIVIVQPDDEDYPYAKATLAAAKNSIIETMRSRIAEAREVIANTRRLRATDVRES
jgi:hypothetical protein